MNAKDFSVETFKHGAFFTVAMAVVGVIGWQPVAVAVEEMVTTKVSARVDAVEQKVDRVEEKQIELHTGQKVLAEKINGIDANIKLLLQLLPARGP